MSAQPFIFPDLPDPPTDDPRLEAMCQAKYPDKWDSPEPHITDGWRLAVRGNQWLLLQAADAVDPLREAVRQLLHDFQPFTTAWEARDPYSCDGEKLYARLKELTGFDDSAL